MTTLASEIRPIESLDLLRYRPAWMSSDSNDPWGLRAALAGDVDAWAGIVDEFNGVMWHWARSQGLGRADAEDAVQNVWYRLADRGSAIEDPRKLPGWLATTTRREAQSRRRRLRRVVNVDDVDEDYQSAFRGQDGSGLRQNPEQEAVASDIEQRLAQAYWTLTERCRELLALVWDSSMSYVAIAEALETTVGAVGPMRLRCLDRLRVAAGLA
jgi:RNA polymerase sigma factor (sigma-70 family)